MRDFLGTRLPGYLVPTHIEVLDKLPLTANGKVDRRALPEPQLSGGPAFVGPRTSTEGIVATIWSELLGRTPIGVRDDFFQLGGHSLVATQVISRLSKACGRELPVRSIFEAPTIERLAALIDSEAGIGSFSATPEIIRSGPARAAELLERLDEFSEAELEELLRDPQLKTAI
jgi:acyl carrier protein